MGLMLGQGVLSLSEAMDAWMEGMKEVTPRDTTRDPVRPHVAGARARLRATARVGPRDPT